MSGVYRSMRALDNKPLVGNERDMLGVRENGADMPVEADGTVQPGSGGLSVAPEWRALKSFLIPRRLVGKAPDARGNNRLVCFRLGDRPFAEGDIFPGLRLRVDSHVHGSLEPSVRVPIGEYQSSLAATRELWLIDED